MPFTSSIFKISIEIHLQSLFFFLEITWDQPPGEEPSSKIKLDDSEKFYDEFMIPTLKRIYKHLPKGKHICLNMPDIMYTKIKKKWKEEETT